MVLNDGILRGCTACLHSNHAIRRDIGSKVGW